MGAPKQTFGFKYAHTATHKSKHKTVNWKIYKQQWENYCIVAQLEKQLEEYRVTLFLYSIGPDAGKIYNNFDLSEANWQKLSEILKEFEHFVIEETNETCECYILNSHNQKEGKSIDACVLGELQTLAQLCNSARIYMTLIHDQIVSGPQVHNGGTCKCLLRPGKLTLQKCIEIAKSDKVSNT